MHHQKKFGIRVLLLHMLFKQKAKKFAGTYTCVCTCVCVFITYFHQVYGIAGISLLLLSFLAPVLLLYSDS